MRRNCTQNVFACLLLASLTLLPSCKDDIFSLPSVDKKGVEVGFYAGGCQTRTAMLPNGLSAEWQPGDDISVWAKNSSGTYTLSNQIFTTYGINSSRGFFTSKLSSAMPEGIYTYYCCYPAPLSVNGTTATFNVPAVQDGKVTGGADVMVATPVQHAALTAIPDPEDHSGLSMKMNRMMHQFRFWFPQEYDIIDEEILEITLSTPQAIAGNVSVDMTDPAAAMSLTGGANSIYLDLTDPIASSATMDDAEFACVSVIPYDGTYTDSDYMNLTVYSQRYKLTVDPISLSGRSFVRGHSTPVRIIPTSSEEYYRLTLKIGDNNIGEHLTNVSVLLDGVNVFYGFDASGEPYANYTNSVEAYGTDGKDAYDNIITSVQSGTAIYTYETEHALVTRPITADMMTYDGNRVVLDLGDVPYLLEEDFSNAMATAHDDDYTAGMNSDRNYGGYLLDGYLPQNGWNASRFSLFEGDCIRVNCRYQSGALVPERVCGRLDTPALKYIKSGVTVNVALEFDEAFYVPAGYNVDDSKNATAHFIIATHTNAEGSAISGENYGDIGSKTTVVYQSANFASENTSDLNHVVVPADIPATSSTRITFWPGTTQNSSKIAANAVYYLYLDNIKVYINN